MGRLIYGLSVSLDGYVETPSRSLDWVRVDEELHSFFNAQGRELGASLYGRRMYELMAGYWPTAENDPRATPAELEWAEIWKRTPKIVFSSSLEGVGWNSRLVRGDAVDEVKRLKAQPGLDMDVGGPTIAAPLIRAGLVDEYRLFVQPVILGAGTPLLPRSTSESDCACSRRAPSSREWSTSAMRLKSRADRGCDASFGG